MQVTLDLSDDPGQVLVGGCQRPNEFVFLDRLYPIAEIEIAIGEETGNDDVAGIDLERLGERLDGIAILVLLAENTAQAHPCRKVRGMMGQAGAKDLLRFIEAIDSSELLRERKEKTTLRIRLHSEA